MNRIEKKFKELKRQRRKAFIGFVTAGDPNLKATPKVVHTLEAAGADIVELGMPFSDPMADGPVIQKSSERALKSGTTLKGIFQAIREIRKKSEIPLLLMGYYNPVLQYGVRRFFSDAKKIGVDGVLLVDLPPEEGEEARRAAKRVGISLVFLLAPTSDAQRIDLVTRKGSGFIYYVSLTGITGARLATSLSSHNSLKYLMKNSRLPVCVGFGVKQAAQAKAIARYGDGVVVGSALVQAMEPGHGGNPLTRLGGLVSRLSRAVHSAS
jgi:tryptophan synthase alpha chain